MQKDQITHESRSQTKPWREHIMQICILLCFDEPLDTASYQGAFFSVKKKKKMFYNHDFPAKWNQRKKVNVKRSRAEDEKCSRLILM